MNARAALIGSFALWATAAGAATFVVTKEADDDGPCAIGDCALREATLAANADPVSADVIVVPRGVYRLTLTGPPKELDAEYGDLDLNGYADVRGDPFGETVIVAPPAERVLELLAVTGELSDLTLTGGSEAYVGGGVLAFFSEVTFRRCTIAGNRADHTGGGLFADLTTISILDSTIHGNSATVAGGGIAQVAPVPPSAGPEQRLTLRNSTVSGNVAPHGGGLYLLSDFLTVQSSTIVDNDSAGPGLAISSREVWKGSLVVGSCGASAPLPPGASGGNLESPGSTCGFSDPSDQTDVADPRLGPLADNGGPTLTHAPLAGSPMLDAGSAIDCPPTDQRGFARPWDGDDDGTAMCDVGAVELGSPGVVAVPATDGVGLAALVALFAVAATLRLRRLVGG